MRNKLSHTKRTLLLATIATLFALSAVVPIIGLTSNAWTCEEFQCITTGRMTGGGVLANSGNTVTLGFELHCSTAVSPNKLEINWGGNQFHLESYNYANCFNDKSSLPNPPKAPFNLLEANGYGRLDGVSGAFVFVQLFDGGEPGVGTDWATIVIYAANGTLVMNVHEWLIGGNFQAHTSNK